jgi:hypothetical protein
VTRRHDGRSFIAPTIWFHRPLRTDEWLLLRFPN